MLFGHIGDKYGRRVALVGTLLLMGVATVLIGLLPTYAAVGLLAPVLLVVCRLLQGLGVGAEYVGAVTMVAEFAPTKRRGYFASMPAAGVFLGIGLAAAVSAAVATLPKEQLLSWGWRVPFLLSVVVVGVGLVIRLRVPETPVFEELRAARARTKVPALTMIRAMPKRFLLVMVSNCVIALNIYVVQTYSLSYLADQGVAKNVALIALLFGCPVGAVAIPLVGHLSDRSGRRPAYLRHRDLRAGAVPVLLAARHRQHRADPARLRARVRQLSGRFRIPGRVLRRAVPLGLPLQRIRVEPGDHRGGAVRAGAGHRGRAGGPARWRRRPARGGDDGGRRPSFVCVLVLPETRGVELAPIVDPDQMSGTTPPPAAAGAPQNRPIATT